VKIFNVEKIHGIKYIDRPTVYGIAIDNDGKIAKIKVPTGILFLVAVLRRKRYLRNVFKGSL
jgi:hypothetical protein